MQTKLTLRLDGALIERAKSWAQARHVSLSQTVAEFFAQLPDESRSDLATLSPWTRRMIGAAASSEPAPSDEEIRQAYHDHLETKHR